MTTSVISTFSDPPAPPTPRFTNIGHLHAVYGELINSYAEVESEEKDDVRPPALLRLTPGAQGANWFSPRVAWQPLRDSLRHGTWPSFEDPQRRDGMKALYEYVIQFDVELFKNMSSPRGDNRLAAVAFSETNIGNHGPGVQWSHALLRSLLVDRLLWALSTDRDSEDTRPPQIPHRCFPSPLPCEKKITRFRKIYLNWPSTVSTLQKAWFDGEASIAQTGCISNIISEAADVPGVQGDLQVLLSLWNGVKVSEAGRIVKVVEKNFCMAALGLRGLVKVCLSVSLQWFVRAECMSSLFRKTRSLS